MAAEDVSTPISRVATGGTLLLWLIPATLYYGFLGLGYLASRPAGLGASMVAVGAFVSVLTAHALWVHVLSPLGSALKVMGPLGILDFYRALFHGS
jgi:hypothetical protein